jgi:hypothetical protein
VVLLLHRCPRGAEIRALGDFPAALPVFGDERLKQIPTFRLWFAAQKSKIQSVNIIVWP